MSILLEDNLPVVKYQGLNTNKNAVFGGSVTFNGSKSGGTKAIITGGGTLTASQSTSLCIFDTAAGETYTLPTPAAGLSFEFFVKTTVTSSNHKVLTPASTFMIGAISYGVLDTTPAANPGPKFTSADGSTIRSITMNGTTTGGLFGTYFALQGISATQWLISGLVIASGTIATPFATS